MASEHSDYKVTKYDILAKFIADDSFVTCETVPTEDGKFKVAILKNGEITSIRNTEYNYDEQDYALYETYRAISKKILNGN